MEQENSFTTHTLPSGLRIICAPGHTDVVYCGIAIGAGTRHELPEESGMAHFTEHMSFKGTCRRSARQVISTMESVGGDMNAYTGKEETVYYCTALRQHVGRAIDLLLDIVTSSTYPDHEMEHEVEVVIDEIESYNDQPSELVYDEFESLAFPGHPLGRSILGDADRLRTFRSEDMKRYARRLYQPSRMVLYVLGNVDAEKIIRMVEKWGGGKMLQAGGALLTLPQDHLLLPREENGGRQVPASDSGLARGKEGGSVIYRQKDTHQAHVVIGTPSFGGNDPRHLHLYLLNNMLGGPAMSSRLNLSLRERNGLVYTVESNNVCYTDTGLWTTYFGCDPEDVRRCCRLVRRELERLVQAPLTQRALDAARRQLKGQIGISYDSYENLAIGMAKRYLHYGRTQTCQQLFDQLDALTPAMLLETAQLAFDPNRLLTLIYSPSRVKS